jgi:hypothetical protein
LWAIATANEVILQSCIQRSSEVAARQGLASSRRCARTKDDLYHNEYKSKIMASNNVISETALDRLFDQIREEVEDLRASPYGFEGEWEDEEEDEEEEEENLNPDLRRDKPILRPDHYVVRGNSRRCRANQTSFRFPRLSLIPESGISDSAHCYSAGAEIAHCGRASILSPALRKGCAQHRLGDTSPCRGGRILRKSVERKEAVGSNLTVGYRHTCLIEGTDDE